MKMDIEIAIFLLLFLSLSLLATIGICFVEIRSCWRNYRTRKYRYEYYNIEPPNEVCICNMLPPPPPAATLTTAATATSNIGNNHIQDKIDEVDDEDPPPQDLLDALVLGDPAHKAKPNTSHSTLPKRPNQQVIFAKNVSVKRNGDPV